MKTPILARMVEWIDKNRVRLFFSTGRVVEINLPVESAKYARIVDQGVGVDPGDGRDLSAYTLYFRKSKELRKDRIRSRAVPFWKKKR